MKKLSTLLFYLALVVAAHAQSVSLTLTTAPCHDDGVLTANVTGLTPPLTVSWHTSGVGATTITHTGVSSLTDALTSYSGGPIYVSVSGTGGSAYSSYAGMPPFTYSLTTTNAVCPALGTASVTVTGGTAPYTYSWFNTSTMATVGTSNPISVPSGNYGVTITDAAGCTYGSMDAYDSAFVYVAPSFSVTTTTTTANCTNGTASVVAAPGSVPPLGYLWSTGATTASIGGLSMGTYHVIVTDAVGCVDSTNAYVTQAITISVPTTPTPATCIASDGAVIAFGSGGTPPYTYLWSNGVTTASQTGLPAGYYGVTVHDANGCIGTGSANVTSSTPITVTYTSTASSCTSATGSASITAAGGTAPYSYMWYTYPVQTTATATSLAPGNYDFKVTDAMGCIRTGTVVVNPVHIITASFTATSATCTLPDGSLHVTPSGGTTPYTFSWDGVSSSSSSITAAIGGYHSVTITDAAGCSVDKWGFIPIMSPMTLGVSSSPASCIFNNDGGASAFAAGGTAPYTYHWTTGASTSSISGVAHGSYWVYVSDAIGCAANRYVGIGYDPTNTSCYCTVQGTVYHDANSNCTQDAGEAGIPNIQLSCGGHYTYTDASGHYSFIVPSGTYTVTETVLAFYPLSSCQSNNIVVTASAATGCTIPVNFANAINPIHDMHISTWDYVPPIPGNTYNQITIVSNDGTVTESAPIGGYKTDGQLFTPTFAPGGIFSGSGNYYTTASGFPSMSAGTAQTYYASYTVPTSIPLGTSVVFKDTAAYATPMSNWLSDYSPWNNVEYYPTNVIGSYDPNFKEVSPKGTGPNGNITYADSVLEYMVHFQNTGTYYAENVVVVDTLDDNLDWTTLRPVYMSAPCKVTLDQSGSSKVATFTFNNIHLPAQTMDDLRSNGMFTYTVKTKHGLAVGSQIRNTASIYFDYNAPIKTNGTLNTIATTGIATPQQAAYGSFALYPNPATNSFNTVINSAADGDAIMLVADITGKTMITKTIALVKGTQTVATDASQLAPGIYLVSLNHDGKTETQKLVIMK